MDAPVKQSPLVLTQFGKSASRADIKPRRQNRNGAAAKSSAPRRPKIDRYFTIRQVAEFLSYSPKQIRRLCEQGKIRTIQASPRAHHRIALSALREFLNQDQSYWADQSDREFQRELLASCDKIDAANDHSRGE
jgi:excisionase family DNA binding protein